MERHGVAWSIGGTAGEGLESAGEAFAKALAACGFRPTTGRVFPSRIRGGDTTFTVRLTPEGFLAPAARVDLAIAFNATILPRMKETLHEGSLLLVDEGLDGETFPFSALAEKAGMPKAKNVVALGASTALLGLPLDEVADAVAQQFSHKGPDVVEANRTALRLGHEEAMSRFGGTRFEAPPPESGEALFLSGNEAACLGALAAGCRVAAAYPITPASDILEFLTPRLAELDGIALQMEDEIAALNVVIGAGFSGARALTATSGPGLSLMSESVGLAGSNEVPAVIIDCQRPGPSTGMPTKHGQEDLWQMVHGGHGEFVRAVVAPTDVSDSFAATSEAFRLAHRFRCPVFVALDQQCSLMKQTVSPFDPAREAAHHEPRGAAPTGDAWEGTFAPYGGDGSPQRVSLPGEADGLYFSNSTEHGPTGFTNELPTVRNAMVERRLARMNAIVEDCRDPILVEGDGDTVLVSWGSTVEACREAAARRPGLRVVAIRLLWPFPQAAVAEAIGERDVIFVEANAFGQLGRLVRSEVPVHDRCRSVLRYDGDPVACEDILEAL